jgi:hypothetical protein
MLHIIKTSKSYVLKVTLMQATSLRENEVYVKVSEHVAYSGTSHINKIASKV